MKTLAAILFIAFSAWSACTKITYPTDYSTVSSGTRANLKANFDAIKTVDDPCKDSVDEMRARFSGYTGSLRMSSLDHLMLRLDTDGSLLGRFGVLNGFTGDTLFRVTEDSTWKAFGAGIGTNLTLSGTLGVTGASTLAALSATTGAFSSTLTATGKFTGSDTVAAVLGFRAGSGTATDVSLYRSAAETWYTPDSLEVLGKIVANARGRFGPTSPTFMTKRVTAIGNSFDNTAFQMENTDVGTAAQGRIFNLGITDISATEGRLDLTQPGERTILSVFYNGNLAIGSTTDGGQGFQVAGTSRFAGAATFASTVSTGALTATTVTTGGGEAFTYGDTSFTMTATGMTTSPTGTAYATRIGNVVNLRIPAISGTSNDGAFTIGTIPSGWRPSASIYQTIPIYTDNGASGYNGTFLIQGNGVVALYTSGGGAWTTSGTKATILTNVTYNLQ